MNLEAGEGARRWRVLVVCTANVCRSPVAERLLGRQLEQAGYPVTVRSAGTHGGRLPVHEHTLVAAADLGVDLHDHRSRALTSELLVDDGADLILTMTREHLRDVVSLDPVAWPRSFTLKELTRRAEAVPRSVTSPAEWIAHAAAGRRAADMVTASPLDDLDDPYGGPLRGHREMVAEVDRLATRLVSLLPSPAR